jgi:hypothetical protein
MPSSSILAQQFSAELRQRSIRIKNSALSETHGGNVILLQTCNTFEKSKLSTDKDFESLAFIKEILCDTSIWFDWLLPGRLTVNWS